MPREPPAPARAKEGVMLHDRPAGALRVERQRPETESARSTRRRKRHRTSEAYGGPSAAGRVERVRPVAAALVEAVARPRSPHRIENEAREIAEGNCCDGAGESGQRLVALRR